MAENLKDFEHHCGEPAVIRRNAKDKLYCVCQGCGVLHYAGAKGQMYLAAELDGIAIVPERDKEPEPPAAPEPVQEPKPAPKKDGLFLGMEL